ncbi:hypothetical protein [Microbulbifer sp. A4B17]|uniref:hypothetical protein n=1 Tax=Microbulbifer sp. A4B17 TaxID=359370 RepID=UPI001300AEA4|nr:hypothetical protein [Microbulbifer sp. A4B17]
MADRQSKLNNVVHVPLTSICLVIYIMFDPVFCAVSIWVVLEVTTFVGVRDCFD